MNRQPVGNIFHRPRRIVRRRVLDAADGIEHARRLDGPIHLLTRAVHRLLPQGRVRDALHGVPIGHPAHPALIDLPIGCWLSAAVLDLSGSERQSRTLIAIGLLGALPTTLTGLTDWSALHREQQRVGLIHALGTGTATGLYAASLLARARGRTASGKAFGYAGLTTLFGGAYLGGHLAFRLGAGATHAESITHLGPLGWHDLCSVGDLPDGRPVHRTLGYISLFVLRRGEDVYVLGDRCAHLGGPLHQGRLVDAEDETCVVCPWHGSTFRVRDGSVMHGPATSRQPAFDTRIFEDGSIRIRPAR